MTKVFTGAMLAAALAAGLALAQESAPEPEAETPAEMSETADPMVLIGDPEPGEPQMFAAEGDTEAEIVTEAEMASEAEAALALDGDMVGDMAALPEDAERPDW